MSIGIRDYFHANWLMMCTYIQLNRSKPFKDFAFFNKKGENSVKRNGDRGLLSIHWRSLNTLIMCILFLNLRSYTFFITVCIPVNIQSENMGIRVKNWCAQNKQNNLKCMRLNILSTIFFRKLFFLRAPVFVLASLPVCHWIRQDSEQAGNFRKERALGCRPYDILVCGLSPIHMPLERTNKGTLNS